MPVLPGDAAQREAVAAVRGDIDLEDLLAQPEQGDRVVAGGQRRGDLRPEVALQDDDPGVVLTDTELVLGADHPVGDMAVGRAGRDGEAARQDRPREDDHDEVADLEVVGAADNLLVLALGGHLAVRSDVDGAPPDRLAVLLRLVDAAQHPADDERASDIPAVKILLLEPDGDEGGGDTFDVLGRNPPHVEATRRASAPAAPPSPPTKTIPRSGRTTAGEPGWIAGMGTTSSTRSSTPLISASTSVVVASAARSTMASPPEAPET